jgi:hypothetical protein
LGGRSHGSGLVVGLCGFLFAMRKISLFAKLPKFWHYFNIISFNLLLFIYFLK